MSSLLGLGEAPGAAAGCSDALSLEEVLALLSDCDAAVHWGARAADGGDSLPLAWPSTPSSEGDDDPLAQLDESLADFVAAQGASEEQALTSPTRELERSGEPVAVEVVASPTAWPGAAAGPTGSTAKKRKKKAGYNSNKARDQRKEELLYLRKKVEQMEAHLRKLKETAARKDGAGAGTLARRPPASTDASAFKVAEVGPVWEDVAARQYKERRRAEMENIRLKLVLEGQIKMAKTLEKVLNKRYNDRVLESIRGKQKLKRVDRPIDPDDDAPIFRELLNGIENALNEVDRDFEANGLARMVKPYNDAQLRRDGLDGSVVMEIFANKMMPFDVTSTGNAVWDHFAHSMERVPARYIYEKELKNVATTNDMIVESFGLELVGSRNNKADLHVRQILRKFVEKDRVVIAWRVYSEPIEVSTERTDGIRLLEKGYTVIKKARSDVDTHSLVQTCYIIRPEIYGTITDQERKVGAVTDFLLESVARTISSSHQMIENVLLDQALRAASPAS